MARSRTYDGTRCLIDQLGEAGAPVLCAPECKRCKANPLSPEHNCYIPNELDSDKLQEVRYRTIDARTAAKVEAVWGEHITTKQALGMKLCRHAQRVLEDVSLPEDVEARIERNERAGERSAAREGAQAAAIVSLVDTGAPLAQPADDYRCPGQKHRGRGPTWKTLVHDGNKMVNVGGTFVCRRCERSERRRQNAPATPAAALPTAAASSPDQENAVQAPAAQVVQGGPGPFPPSTQCKLMTTATACTPIPCSTTSRPRSEHSPVKSPSIRSRSMRPTEELAPLCTCTAGMASGGFCAGQRFFHALQKPLHDSRPRTS